MKLWSECRNSILCRDRHRSEVEGVLQQILHKDNYFMHLLLIDTRKLQQCALYFNLKRKVPVQNEAEQYF